MPAKLSCPDRHQTKMEMVALDDLIPQDHRVRVVWQYVEGLDVSALEKPIKSMDGGSGRPAIAPRLLLALWLYATIDGVGSARALARLCEESLPYRWLCGEVGVNYHTLSDFRVGQRAFLNDLLTRSVGSLLHQKLVTLERVAQDGVRVRASAGQSSFHRRETLQECVAEAKAQVQALETELAADPSAGSLRQQAARRRAAQERQERIQQALAAVEELEAEQAKREHGRPGQRKKEPRASSTDPESRLMRMSDGGTRPAYNVQYATDSGSRLIVGVAVTNGGDQPQLVPMLEQLVERYATPPREHLVDGGYVSKEAIVAAEALGTTVFMPTPEPRSATRAADEPRRDDPPAVAAWRIRMGTEYGKAVYAQRPQFAEWVNAQARNRGLTKFTIRGLAKATAVALWYALAHNLVVLSQGTLALAA